MMTLLSRSRQLACIALARDTPASTLPIKNKIKGPAWNKKERKNRACKSDKIKKYYFVLPPSDCLIANFYCSLHSDKHYADLSDPHRYVTWPWSRIRIASPERPPEAYCIFVLLIFRFLRRPCGCPPRPHPACCCPRPCSHCCCFFWLPVAQQGASRPDCWFRRVSENIILMDIGSGHWNKSWPVLLFGPILFPMMSTNPSVPVLTYSFPYPSDGSLLPTSASLLLAASPCLAPSLSPLAPIWRIFLPDPLSTISSGSTLSPGTLVSSWPWLSPRLVCKVANRSTGRLYGLPRCFFVRDILMVEQ